MPSGKRWDGCQEPWILVCDPSKSPARSGLDVRVKQSALLLPSFLLVCWDPGVCASWVQTRGCPFLPSFPLSSILRTALWNHRGLLQLGNCPILWLKPVLIRNLKPSNWMKVGEGGLEAIQSWMLGREDSATVATGARQGEESGRDEAVLGKLWLYILGPPSSSSTQEKKKWKLSPQFKNSLKTCPPL